MIMKQKIIKNIKGTFTLNRHDTSQNFVCDRCLSPKVAKVVVSWVGPTVDKTLCNGCYGKVLSEID